MLTILILEEDMRGPQPATIEPGAGDKIHAPDVVDSCRRLLRQPQIGRLVPLWPTMTKRQPQQPIVAIHPLMIVFPASRRNNTCIRRYPITTKKIGFVGQGVIWGCPLQ